MGDDSSINLPYDRMRIDEQWPNFNWVKILCTRWTESHKKHWKIYIRNGIEWKINSWRLPVFLDNLWFLEYELSFLVLLWCLVGSFILPSQHLEAICTMDISNGVETGCELPVFLRPHTNVHSMGEQKCSAMSSLKTKFRKMLDMNAMNIFINEMQNMMLIES